MDSRITDLPDDSIPESPQPLAGGAGVPPANVTPTTGSGTVPEETSEERFERLKMRVMEKRRQQAIADMERELAGEEPAFRATIPDSMPASGQKRPASPSAEESASKRVMERVRKPGVFSGKDIAELDTFDASFRIYFEAIGVKNATQQIQMAAAHLTDNPMKAWSRKRPDISQMTWDKFITYLKSLLADPANALANASKRLKDIRLAKGQKVRDFREQIEQLERDVPEQTKEVREAWSFLNSLSPDLRREVLREQKTITSRDQVSASAQRFEELAEMEARKKPDDKDEKPSKSKDSPANTKQGSGKKQAKGGSASTDKSKTSKTLTCFNCGKKGHKADECRSAPKEKSDDKDDKKESKDSKESKKGKPKSQ
jgi:Ty3 transposon capsid-like protein/zinc knuckle protein